MSASDNNRSYISTLRSVVNGVATLTKYTKTKGDVITFHILLCVSKKKNSPYSAPPSVYNCVWGITSANIGRSHLHIGVLQLRFSFQITSSLFKIKPFHCLLYYNFCGVPQCTFICLGFVKPFYSKT